MVRSALLMVALVLASSGCSTPTQATTPVGNLRGFVYGASGVSQPISLAVVRVGNLSTTTAEPHEDQLVDDVDSGAASVTVKHDFADDELGAVLAERRLRAKPGGPDGVDKYVYLRRGEYFLEGVPAGRATAKAIARRPSADGVGTDEVVAEKALEVIPYTNIADFDFKVDVPATSK